ncbi:hypothetical protein AVEN_196140-1 [Araneus ventricosus]|uniref:Uncharacterized protein n=1 Tax=Araneus ventricosus TaxID=182803 RepID=A0A4Y2E0U5_ARAVE|nr:hypothetical protein AVEN_196140-1 [Araneus ventricosus]
MTRTATEPARSLQISSPDGFGISAPNFTSTRLSHELFSSPEDEIRPQGTGMGAVPGPWAPFENVGPPRRDKSLYPVPATGYSTTATRYKDLLLWAAEGRYNERRLYFHFQVTHESCEAYVKRIVHKHKLRTNYLREKLKMQPLYLFPSYSGWSIPFVGAPMHSGASAINMERFTAIEE